MVGSSTQSPLSCQGPRGQHGEGQRLWFLWASWISGGMALCSSLSFLNDVVVARKPTCGLVPPSLNCPALFTASQRQSMNMGTMIRGLKVLATQG